MTACPKCNGTGLRTRGFWIFKKVHNCDKCDGTGQRLEVDRSKGVTVAGDKRRIQMVIHAMAEARRKKTLADEKGKNTYEANRLLNRAADHLRENRYDEALEAAKEADELASALL